MNETLLDRIYEAAVVPELWEDVLQRLTVLGSGAGASFITGGAGEMRWVATHEIDHLIREHAKPGTPPISRAPIALSAPPYNGFQIDQDIMSIEQMDTDPFYTEFLRPRGYGWCIGTVIAPPACDPIILAVERRFKDGPASPELVRQFDPLRPHLARAALWSSRLALERSHAATAALNVVGLPAAVIGGGGRLISANSLLGQMIPRRIQDRNGRISLVHAEANDLLLSALSDVSLKLEVPGVYSIPVPAIDDEPPVIFHVTPIKGVAHDLFANAVAIMVATPIVSRPVPGSRIIEGLFDLTPAEGKLAAAIAAGFRPREAASSLGISEETARTTLKRLFVKMGVNRQADLIGLLRGTSFTQDK